MLRQFGGHWICGVMGPGRKELYWFLLNNPYSGSVRQSWRQCSVRAEMLLRCCGVRRPLMISADGGCCPALSAILPPPAPPRRIMNTNIIIAMATHLSTHILHASHLCKSNGFWPKNYIVNFCPSPYYSSALLASSYHFTTYMGSLQIFGTMRHTDIIFSELVFSILEDTWISYYYVY